MDISNFIYGSGILYYSKNYNFDAYKVKTSYVLINFSLHSHVHVHKRVRYILSVSRHEYSTSISNEPMFSLRMPSLVICPHYTSTDSLYFSRYQNFSEIQERCLNEENLTESQLVNAREFESNVSFAGYDSVQRYYQAAVIPIEHFFISCYFHHHKAYNCSEVIEYVNMPGGVCYKVKSLEIFTSTEPRFDTGFDFTINLYQH